MIKPLTDLQIRRKYADGKADTLLAEDNEHMSENEYKAAGFSFSDSQEYKEAKREAETVEYIKANTDLSDLNKAAKLYHKLVERKTLKTVVGYAFLKELQERIIREGIIGSESMPNIRVERDKKQIKAYSGSLEHDQEKKHAAVVENYRIRLRNSRIISAFLVVIIIVMFAIAIFSDRGKFTDYENKILNKYSAWEEALDTREKELDAREKALKE